MKSDVKKTDQLLQAMLESAPGGNLELLLIDPKDERWIRDFVDAAADEVRTAGADAAALLAGWSEKYPAPLFWKEVGQRLSSALLVWRETAFLRAMGDEAQKAYMGESFELMIRYQESQSYLQERLKVGREEYRATTRVYATLITWFIERRYSHRRFVERCQSFFFLSEAVSEYLWDVLSENRPMLVEWSMLRSINVMRQMSGQVNAILDILLNDDDDGEGDEEEE